MFGSILSSTDTVAVLATVSVTVVPTMVETTAPVAIPVPETYIPATISVALDTTTVKAAAVPVAVGVATGYKAKE